MTVNQSQSIMIQKRQRNQKWINTGLIACAFIQLCADVRPYYRFSGLFPLQGNCRQPMGGIYVVRAILRFPVFLEAASEYSAAEPL